MTNDHEDREALSPPLGRGGKGIGVVTSPVVPGSGALPSSDASASVEERLTALERDTHPPIDLTPAMDDLLDERGYLPAALVARLLGEPSEDMLNAAQERLCQISSRTSFSDYEQAEMFKAMAKAAVQRKAP